jgi:hypothetical protein
MESHTETALRLSSTAATHNRMKMRPGGISSRPRSRLRAVSGGRRRPGRPAGTPPWSNDCPYRKATLGGGGGCAGGRAGRGARGCASRAVSQLGARRDAAAAGGVHVVRRRRAVVLVRAEDISAEGPPRGTGCGKAAPPPQREVERERERERELHRGAAAAEVGWWDSAPSHHTASGLTLGRSLCALCGGLSPFVWQGISFRELRVNVAFRARSGGGHLGGLAPVDKELETPSASLEVRARAPRRLEPGAGAPRSRGTSYFPFSPAVAVGRHPILPRCRTHATHVPCISYALRAGCFPPSPALATRPGAMTGQLERVFVVGGDWGLL